MFLGYGCNNYSCRMIFYNCNLFYFIRLGFPYSAAINSIAPHRSLVVHTSREFYNKVKNLTMTLIKTNVNH